ncbi:MAG: helicase-related protein [Christensenellales bacterium]
MFTNFPEGFDVLVCSTIIENGIDMPNANTLVVCDADRLGLSQPHQLRGFASGAEAVSPLLIFCTGTAKYFPKRLTSGCAALPNTASLAAASKLP